MYIFRGYLAPEYIVHGKLTEKADVYSFGILVLEVVCGKRNNSFSQNSHSILQMVNLFTWHTTNSCFREIIFFFQESRLKSLTKLLYFFIRFGIFLERESYVKLLIQS